MGNLSKLSIMSLESLAVLSVGCIRCNSASCSAILPPSKLYFLRKKMELLSDALWVKFSTGLTLYVDLNDHVPEARSERHKAMNPNNSHKSLWCPDCPACLEEIRPEIVMLSSVLLFPLLGGFYP